MRKLLLLAFSIFAFASLATAETVTFSAQEKWGESDATKLGGSSIDVNDADGKKIASISLAQNSGSNDIAYYKSDHTLRFYRQSSSGGNGGSFTITPETGLILTKVTYLTGSTNVEVAISNNSATYQNTSGSNVSIKSITIEYEGSSGPAACAIPTWNRESGDIYPGDKVVATSTTEGCVVFIKDAYSGVQLARGYESAEFEIKGSALGNQLYLAAYAAMDNTDPNQLSPSADSQTLILNVVEQPKSFTETLTATTFDISGTTYTLYKATGEKSGVDYYAKASLSNGIQINTTTSSTDNKVSSGIISQSNPGNYVIDKIVITQYGGTGTPIMKMSNEPGKVTGEVGQTGTNVKVEGDSYGLVITAEKTTNSENKTVYTYTPESDYGYFALTSDAKAFQISSIEITYRLPDPNYIPAPQVFLNYEKVEGTKEALVGDEVTIISPKPDVRIQYELLPEGGTPGNYYFYDPFEPIRLKAGKYTFTAYSEYDNYESDRTVIKFNVNKHDAGLKFDTTTKVVSVDAEPFINPLTNPNELSITWESSNPSKASVAADGTVTPIGSADLEIFAKSEETDYYLPGNASYKLTINRIDANVKFEQTSYSVNLGDEFETVLPTNPDNLQLFWTSSDTEIATVEEATGAVTILKAGVVDIRAGWLETDRFNGGVAKFTLRIVDPNVKEEAKSILFKTGDDVTGTTNTTVTTTDISTYISEGADLIKEYTTVTGGNYDNKGLRFGAKSSAGEFKFTLKEKFSGPSVTIVASEYSDNDSPTIQLNGSTTQSVSGAEQKYTFSITEPTDVFDIKTSKRVVIKSITFDVENGDTPDTPNPPADGIEAYVNGELLVDGMTISSASVITVKGPEGTSYFDYYYTVSDEYDDEGEITAEEALDNGIKCEVGEIELLITAYDKEGKELADAIYTFTVALTDKKLHFESEEITVYLDELDQTMENEPKMLLPKVLNGDGEVANVSLKIEILDLSVEGLFKIKGEALIFNGLEGDGYIYFKFSDGEYEYVDNEDMMHIIVKESRPKPQTYAHTIDFSDPNVHEGHTIYTTGADYEAGGAVYTVAPITLETSGNTRIWYNDTKGYDFRMPKESGFSISLPDDMYIQGVTIHHGNTGSADKWTIDDASGQNNSYYGYTTWEFTERKNSVVVKNTNDGVNSISAIDVMFSGPKVSVPEFDDIPYDKTHISYCIKSGHLHLQHALYKVYDDGSVEYVHEMQPFSVDGFVEETPDTPTEETRFFRPMRVSESSEIIDLSKAWTAPVTSDHNGTEHQVGTPFLVNLPELNDNEVYMVVAKSVDNGLHSDEDVQMINATGDIVTGLDLISAASATTTVYFNLQGIRVSEPQPGELYIRVKGAKTERIIF